MNTYIERAETLLWKISFSTATLMIISFLRFILVYLSLKINRIFIRIIYFLGLIAIIIILFTDRIIKGMDFTLHAWGYDYIIGDLFFIIAIFLVVTIFLSFALVLRQYIKTKKSIEKLRLKYILIGLSFPLILGSLFDLVLPAFEIPSPKFAAVSLAIMIAFIMYSIYRWQTFGVSFRKLTISTRLIITFISIFVVTVFISAFLNFISISAEVRSGVSNRLTVAVSNKSEWLKLNFDHLKNDVDAVTKSLSIKYALDAGLKDAYDLARNDIKKEAVTVAAEAEQYIENHPQKTIKDLQQDPEFKKIAVQAVGKTGYTAIQEYNSLINRFHKNPAIVNVDLHTLKTGLPEFWSIIARSQGGRNADGAYLWLDLDGQYREKYMYITKINALTADGVGLSVAATTYLQEYESSIKILYNFQNLLKDYNKSFGNYNTFLISKNGNVWWSAESRAVDNTNLIQEEYKNTQLAKTYTQIAQDKKIIISDFVLEPYDKNITFFVGGPVFDTENNFLGAVVFQSSTTEINMIMSDRVGLQSTGKTYIVGSDLLARTDPDLDNAGAALKLKIDTENTKGCFEDYSKYYDNQTGEIKNHIENAEVFNFLDWRGVNVLGSHEYFPLLKWCILGEMDQEEILSLPRENILVISYQIALFVGFFVLLIGYVIARSISNPIKRLIQGVNLIQAGNLDNKVGTDDQDEIGELSRAFDGMTLNIKKSQKEVIEKVQKQTEEIKGKSKELEDNNLELSQSRLAAINILEDVEEEKKIAEEEKNKLETILHGIGDAVIVIDSSRKIVIFNSAAEKLIGYKAEEVIGENYQKIICITLENYAAKVSDRSACKNVVNVEQCFLTGEFLTIPANSVIFTKNNEKIFVSGISTCIKDKNKETIGSIIVLRDTTKEKEIDKAKTEFISIASHQLRTPASAIKWFLEMLSAGDAGPLIKEQKEFVDQAYQSNERMIKLINDLLNVSRMEAGKTKVEPKPGADVDSLIQSIVDEFKPLAIAKNVSIVLNKDKIKLPLLAADVNKLKEAIANLISNAVKYNKARGLVEINYKREPNQVVFSITDNGLGIPSDQKKRIFEKFFRADNTVAVETEGTGLGLYISKSIIEGHGGKIWFESEEGKGTTFYFSLPLG